MNMTGLSKKYRDKGFKLTPQRMAILNYLKGNKTHPSIEAIFSAIKPDYPTLSLATVYNTIDALKKIGEVTEINIDSGRSHYDPDTRVHNHIICKQCGKIEDVFIDYSSALILPKEVLDGFEVKVSCVEFYGICKECKN